jgi:hypothetical protein
MKNLLRTLSLTLLASTLSPFTCAQFSGNIQGDVRDTSGAAVANATVTLTSISTNVQKTTTSNRNGDYRFVSLAPADYKISVKAPGFNGSMVAVTLLTDQTLNLPLELKVGSTSESVTVTAEAPVLDTADSRTHLTIETEELSNLPLQGRSMVTLVTVAPGVTGLGLTAGGDPFRSRPDNYAVETQVDASANGRGSVGNMYVVDGMDITSDIRPGVLNLTPNPDAIQETSIQTNTFSTEFGRASSVEMVMTTKSGTNQFHGSASDYFTNQNLWSLTEFAAGQKYSPFHSHNFSGTIGGPILPKHQFFFFFAIEPLRSTISTANSPQSFEDAQFTAWAQQNFPNTLGTSVLTNYKASGATVTGVAETAAQVFGLSGASACGTAATANIPCSLPMIDNGVFNSSSYRNGLQWNTRIDKYFSKDRIYGNLFRTTLNTGGPAVRPAFTTTQPFVTDSLQVSEAHTFSGTMLNEAAFGYTMVQGTGNLTGNFTVPPITVAGMGDGFGIGFAQSTFIQNNYHWRDVLTTVAGSHSLKFGYEGRYGDDLAHFAKNSDEPSFSFNNLLALVEDQPFQETGLAYNPLTGQPAKGQYEYAIVTHGLFIEDTWKARHDLTLTYGLRWDDNGNPFPLPGTVLANFHLGAGNAMNQQIANGFMLQQGNVFNHAPMGFSPRAGFSWDPTGTGNWVVRGGFGIYHDWLTLGNDENGLGGNPPGYIIPTFLNTGATSAPIFALGSSASTPAGYPYPVLPATQLDSHGGLVGTQISVGGRDVNLSAPITYNYTATLERKLVKDIVASVGYSGSRSSNLVDGSGQVNNTAYGTDINRFAGDLIQNNGVVTRLNPSFGTITYSENGAIGRYNSFILASRGRFAHHGYFNASYTRSKSKDDAQNYPTATDIHQYYGPSIWDAPNHLSLSLSYELPGANAGKGLLGRLTSGWSVSDITILQSGTPFVVSTNLPFSFTCTTVNACGDFNADGDNYDFPNVTNYTQGTSRQAYLNGIFTAGQFTVPTLGAEGNEQSYRFRGPGYANTDISLSKNTRIAERADLQVRFDFFNTFNRPNLNSVDGNIADSTFGKATGQFNPRWIQLGASIKF